MRLNKDKIEYFYQQIIESYEPEIKELYWGNKDDFISLIEQADESDEGEDNIIITCKNGEEIGLSRLLCDFLFRGEEHCFFDNPVGQRYKYKDYIFLELIESPIVSIKKKIEKSGIFPITRNENGNIDSCFFIKSEKYYDYPKEIIPFFVSQIKDRLKIFKERLPTNFIDNFNLIKYTLKIKECEDILLVKLLYKLGANLGIVENSTIENQDLTVQQEIQSILDSENNINLTNDPVENLDSLKFYTIAIKNPNPYYRFLDAYHIMESFFHKYFYNFVKNLNNNVDKAKLYDDIKQHVREERKMLKLVLENSFNINDFIKIKRQLLNIRAHEIAGRIEKEVNIENWRENDIKSFSSKLSDFIYTFRNAIVHSRESNRYIEKIEEPPSLMPKFIDLTNILFEIAKGVLEKNFDKW